MDKCWKNLPDALALKIIDMSEDIDLRRAFGFLPRKLDESRGWRLWYLLKSHDGLIYNLETKSLHILRIPGCHVIRRPIDLDYIDRWTWMFNQEGKSHTVEITTSSGAYCFVPDATDYFYTEMNVLLKGSGLARVINYAGSTL
jgi:hypothetical protein